MLSWKHTLLCKCLICFGILLLFLRFIGSFCFEEKSVYEGSETIFEGIITKYTMDGNSLSMTIKAKESLVVFYTIQREEEKVTLEKELGYGKKVRVVGELQTPTKATLPNTFDYQEYLYYNHIHYTLKATSISVTGVENIFYFLKNQIRSYLDTFQNKEYFYAFLLGETSMLDLSASKTNGITHLFAISGMHLSILLFLVSKLLKKNRWYKHVVICSLLCYYTFLANYSPSILRVVLLYYLEEMNHFFHLKWTKKQLLFITFVFLLFCDPFFIKNIGFQFSFLIAYSFLFLKKGSKYWRNLLKVSFVAFFASLPISAMHFYEVNFCSILFNFFFVPFVSILIYPFCLFVLFFPFLENVISIFFHIFESMNLWCSSITFGIIAFPKISGIFWICYYFLFFRMLKSKTNPLKYFVFLILLLFFIKVYPKWDWHAYVYFLDVGQGDAVLFVSPHQQEVLLIDTGGTVEYPKSDWQIRMNTYEKAETIKTFFYSLGIQTVDSMILTHGDTDHIGNAFLFLSYLKVGNVIFNLGEYVDLEKELIKLLKEKNIKYYQRIDNLNLGVNNLYFLNTGLYENENDNSIVMYLKVYNIQFLFMGDASIEREKDILKSYSLSNIDFLKVGHHGSNTSTSKDFIESIQPKYSLISVGKNNVYGHPKKEVLETLANSVIYRTDLNGTIQVKIDKKGYMIKTYPP